MAVTSTGTGEIELKLITKTTDREDCAGMDVVVVLADVDNWTVPHSALAAVAVRTGYPTLRPVTLLEEDWLRS